MDRPACASLPAFALQLLLAERPEWKELPVAVVDRDEPQGLLLAINERAWRRRLRPGMRYGAALSLERSLRGGVVAAASIVAATTRLTELFRKLTPGVEVSHEEAGVFWLDGRGLGLLYASASAWGRAVHEAIVREGFEAVVVVGFTRFGVHAVARQHRPKAPGDGAASGRDAASGRSAASGRDASIYAANVATSSTATGQSRWSPVVVFASAAEEHRAVHATPLERLGIDATLRATFERLGLRTLGDLLRLPPQGIRRRFGDEAWKLHERASGRAWDPLTALPAQEPVAASTLLDDPVTSSDVLLFIVRRLLSPLLERLAAREEAAAAICVVLHTDLKQRREPSGEENAIRAAAHTSLLRRSETSGNDSAPAPTSFELCLRAAAPTLDEAVLLDLVRLRLQRLSLPRGVLEIEIEVEAGAADREQLRLFAGAARRDLRAGERALARLRAELGADSVMHAVLREGHLPEATFTWQPLVQLSPAAPRVVRVRPLVRRLYTSAVALPPRPFRERDDCWISSATGHGRIENMVGPYIVSGGWWLRQLSHEVHREYHYASTDSGELLWVYYDRRRRRWFLQGRVE